MVRTGHRGGSDRGRHPHTVREGCHRNPPRMVDSAFRCFHHYAGGRQHHRTGIGAPLSVVRCSRPHLLDSGVDCANPGVTAGDPGGYRGGQRLCPSPPGSPGAGNTEHAGCGVRDGATIEQPVRSADCDGLLPADPVGYPAQLRDADPGTADPPRTHRSPHRSAGGSSVARRVGKDHRTPEDFP